MSDTAITIEKLKDEEYVREIVEGLGGAKAIVEGIREHGRIVKRMWAERSRPHGSASESVGGDGQGWGRVHRRFY